MFKVGDKVVVKPEFAKVEPSDPYGIMWVEYMHEQAKTGEILTVEDVVDSVRLYCNFKREEKRFNDSFMYDKDWVQHYSEDYDELSKSIKL